MNGIGINVILALANAVVQRIKTAYADGKITVTEACELLKGVIVDAGVGAHVVIKTDEDGYMEKVMSTLRIIRRFGIFLPSIVADMVGELMESLEHADKDKQITLFETADLLVDLSKASDIGEKVIFDGTNDDQKEALADAGIVLNGCELKAA